MKRILAVLLIGAMTLVGCGASGSTKQEGGKEIEESKDVKSDLAYVEDKGKLAIGYTIYEPMNFMDEDGELTGFETEFAEKVCEKLGVEPDFIEIAWDSKVIELEAKNIDCIWNGMTITDELKESIAISNPYVKNMQVLVVKKDSGITSTADLVGKSVAVEAGSAAIAAVEGDESLSQAEMLTVTKQTDALVEVKAGTSTAAVLDWTLANSMLGDDTDFAELTMVEGVELSLEEYGIGFRKDSDLKTEVDKIIAELITDGTLPELAEEYELNLVK